MLGTGTSSVATRDEVADDSSLAGGTASGGALSASKVTCTTGTSGGVALSRNCKLVSCLP